MTFEIIYVGFIALIAIGVCIVACFAGLERPWIELSTKHTRDTQVPQTYWQHAAVAIPKSAYLIWLGLAGIVHGILPEIKGLQFYTSSGILRAAKFLLDSGRHDDEFMRIFGEYDV